MDLRRAEATGGFWILRVASTAVTRQRRMVRAEDNRENVPPEGWVASRPWRSVLPEWYPRTPLRDITAIVNALERRRLRVQAAARAVPVNRETESPPEDSTPSVIDQDNHFDSTPNPTPTGIASSSPVQHPLPTPSSSSSNSHAEYEEKVTKYLEEIARILKKTNLKKKSVQGAFDRKRAMQRRHLMSMR